jgi:hypothetical protein
MFKPIFLDKTRYIPSRHGIFKHFTLDCTSELQYNDPTVTMFQEMLSSSISLVITPLRAANQEYFCISTNSSSLEDVQKYINRLYVLELEPFKYNDVCISIESGVIFSPNEDYISLMYILLKNRLQYNHEFKIHDTCIYHDGSLKIGSICGISDNANKETIYNVKPYKEKGTRKTFNHSEVYHCTGFRKYYNLPNTTDVFFMDCTAEVDKGMYFCGF